MAAAVVLGGPAGWWRWHRRVRAARAAMGKELPLPSAPAAPLWPPGGERPGLSRGSAGERCRRAALGGRGALRAWRARPRVWRAPRSPRRAAPPARDPPGERCGGRWGVCVGLCVCHGCHGALPPSGCRVIWGRTGASERLSSINVFTRLLKIACLEIIRARKCFLGHPWHVSSTCHLDWGSSTLSILVSDYFP